MGSRLFSYLQVQQNPLHICARLWNIVLVQLLCQLLMQSAYLYTIEHFVHVTYLIKVSFCVPNILWNLYKVEGNCSEKVINCGDSRLRTLKRLDMKRRRSAKVASDNEC